MIQAARSAHIPIVFCREVHRKTRIDFGRELDGAEGLHCLEGDLGTELIDGLAPEGDGEHLIVQRRYSSFYGTDLRVLSDRGVGSSEESHGAAMRARVAILRAPGESDQAGRIRMVHADPFDWPSYSAISTSASTSTGISSGSSAMPTAERV